MTEPTSEGAAMWVQTGDNEYVCVRRVQFVWGGRAKLWLNDKHFLVVSSEVADRVRARIDANLPSPQLILEPAEGRHP